MAVFIYLGVIGAASRWEIWCLKDGTKEEAKDDKSFEAHATFHVRYKMNQTQAQVVTWEPAVARLLEKNVISELQSALVELVKSARRCDICC